MSFKFYFDGKLDKAKIIVLNTNSDFMHVPIEDVDDVFMIENPCDEIYNVIEPKFNIVEKNIAGF